MSTLFGSARRDRVWSEISGGSAQKQRREAGSRFQRAAQSCASRRAFLLGSAACGALAFTPAAGNPLAGVAALSGRFGAPLARQLSQRFLVRRFRFNPFEITIGGQRVDGIELFVEATSIMASIYKIHRIIASGEAAADSPSLDVRDFPDVSGGDILIGAESDDELIGSAVTHLIRLEERLVEVSTRLRSVEGKIDELNAGMQEILDAIDEVPSRTVRNDLRTTIRAKIDEYEDQRSLLNERYIDLDRLSTSEGELRGAANRLRTRRQDRTLPSSQRPTSRQVREADKKADDAAIRRDQKKKEIEAYFASEYVDEVDRLRKSLIEATTQLMDNTLSEAPVGPDARNAIVLANAFIAEKAMFNDVARRRNLSTADFAPRETRYRSWFATAADPAIERSIAGEIIAFESAHRELDKQIRAADCLGRFRPGWYDLAAVGIGRRGMAPNYLIAQAVGSVNAETGQNVIDFVWTKIDRSAYLERFDGTVQNSSCLARTFVQPQNADALLAQINELGKDPSLSSRSAYRMAAAQIAKIESAYMWRSLVYAKQEAESHTTYLKKTLSMLSDIVEET